MLLHLLLRTELVIFKWLIKSLFVVFFLLRLLSLVMFFWDVFGGVVSEW